MHGRPPAFDGVDGFAYSVEIMTDTTDKPASPWGAYLLFVRWGAGEPEVRGHIETDFILTGDSEPAVRHGLAAMQLSMVKATLDGLIRKQDTGASRPWWEVAQAEADDN